MFSFKKKVTSLQNFLSVLTLQLTIVVYLKNHLKSTQEIADYFTTLYGIPVKWWKVGDKIANKESWFWKCP